VSHSRLDPDLAAALQVLQRAFGPLRALDVHPTPPGRRPATPPAAAGPDPAQPGLFDPTPESEPASPMSATDPDRHLPPSRRWRQALARAGVPIPTPSTRRSP
jgi:hypothetical protein